MIQSLAAACAGLLLISAIAAADEPVPQFQHGDRVTLIGDSITHGRKWHRYVASYYLTRFPDRQVRFFNMGIAGDTSGGALRRLEWDILPDQPTVATIFLGMNDVGLGNYRLNPDEQALARQQASLDNYRNNMDQLATGLLANGVRRLYVFTPSPYDDTAKLENPAYAGANAGLAKCGLIGSELAAKHEGFVIDLHGPMTGLNLQRQQQDPAFTVIGPDRVHPGDPGMMVIASLVLRAQGCPALVSSVAVDGVLGELASAENADVTGIKRTDQGVSFDCLAKALPWPIEPAARPALELVPLEAELNQERLSVRLPEAGAYRLLIEGQEVGQYDSVALAGGINLALNDKTPQHKQAMEVWRLAEQRAALEVRLRTVSQMRTGLVAAKVDEDDPAAVEAHFTAFLGRLGENMKPYYTNQINVYKTTRPQIAEIRAKLEELQQTLWQLNQPKRLHYELARVQ